MSNDAACCGSAPRTAKTKPCLVCGNPARAVERLTVAAMTTRPLSNSRDYWVCRNPDCIVYFDDEGETIELADLKIRPRFKRGDLICYCFGFKDADVLTAPEGDGRNIIVRQIREAVREDHCACNVRNPTGKCCLGEINELLKTKGLSTSTQ